MTSAGSGSATGVDRIGRRGAASRSAPPRLPASSSPALRNAPTATGARVPFSSRCSGCQARVTSVRAREREKAEDHRARDPDVLRHVDGQEPGQPSDRASARACSHVVEVARAARGPGSRGGTGRAGRAPRSAEPPASCPASQAGRIRPAPAPGRAAGCRAPRCPAAARARRRGSRPPARSGRRGAGSDQGRVPATERGERAEAAPGARPSYRHAGRERHPPLVGSGASTGYSSIRPAAATSSPKPSRSSSRPARLRRSGRSQPSP